MEHVQEKYALQHSVTQGTHLFVFILGAKIFTYLFRDLCKAVVWGRRVLSLSCRKETKWSLRMLESILSTSFYTLESTSADNGMYSTQGSVFWRHCSSSHWLSDKTDTSAHLSRQIFSGVELLVRSLPSCLSSCRFLHLFILVTYDIRSWMMDDGMDQGSLFS